MYDPGRGYWINVSIDSLTSEEKARVREYLDFPHNIVSNRYIFFYFQENAGVIHIGTATEAVLRQDVRVDPKEFMHLFKIFCIDKQLALITCVDTVKRKLEEVFGGLE